MSEVCQERTRGCLVKILCGDVEESVKNGGWRRSGNCGIAFFRVEVRLRIGLERRVSAARKRNGRERKSLPAVVWSGTS